MAEEETEATASEEETEASASEEGTEAAASEENAVSSGCLLYTSDAADD